MQTPLPVYTAQDYRADIARDTETLKTTTDLAARRNLEARIRAAKAYIADPTPSFKW